jgi:hypothetical protein
MGKVLLKPPWVTTCKDKIGSKSSQTILIKEKKKQVILRFACQVLGQMPTNQCLEEVL